MLEEQNIQDQNKNIVITISTRIEILLNTYLKKYKVIFKQACLTNPKFKVIDDSENIVYVILNFVTLVIAIMNKLRIFISNMLLVFKYAEEQCSIPSHVLN